MSSESSGPARKVWDPDAAAARIGTGTQKTVLHSITGLNVGGAEYMLARLLPSLNKSACRSAILSLMTPGSLAPLVSSHGPVHSLHISQGKLQLAKVPDLRRIVREVKPDLIHGWMYHGNMAASIGQLWQRSSVPVIWSIHHSLYDIATEKPLTRTLLRLSALLSKRVSAITYCSRVAAAQHEAIGFSAARGIVIHNGIDCEEFSPDFLAKSRLQKELNIPQTRIIVGSVGRNHPMKRQPDLLGAVALLVNKGFDVHCVLIGPGIDSGDLRKVSAGLNINDRVSLLGSTLDIPRIVAGFDIHAISSAWGEAYSLATAEAMACAIPVVVTDVGDCPYLVGDTGLSVPRLAPEALAGALQQLIEIGVERRREIGAAARRRIKDNFSLAEYARKHLQLYEQVVSGMSIK